jgi:hypothetical protein
VSRVEPSHFEPGTAYVSFDGHRRDDFKAYVLKTTDYGRTWTNISANIPSNEPVYVVKEDLKNPRLMFAGTEFAVYASVDGGGSWHKLMNGFPTVAVHDLTIHPRDGDLVAATHGRSMWILDDITALQQLTDDVLASDVFMFRNKGATKWRGISRGATRGHFLFMGRNPLTITQRPPANSASELQNSAAITYWLKAATPVKIEVATWDDSQKFTADVQGAAGINRYYWQLRFASAAAANDGAAGRGGRGGRGGGGGGGAASQVPAGTYRVRLTANGKTYESTITVREDPDAGAVIGD